MLGPSRPLPKIGARTRVIYFGGNSELGVVVGVYEAGRRLRVLGEAGEELEFVLSQATAKFISAEGSGRERLELLKDD